MTGEKPDTDQAEPEPAVPTYPEVAPEPEPGTGDQPEPVVPTYPVEPGESVVVTAEPEPGAEAEPERKRAR